MVSWVNDQDVPFCPDCGGKFNIRNRRHHCRLCGSIMCRKCTEFVPLQMACELHTHGLDCNPCSVFIYIYGCFCSVTLVKCFVSDKLTTGTKEALYAPGSPGQRGSPGAQVAPQIPRRGSISSISSVTSVLEEKDEDRVRCCHHCMDTLMRHQHKLEEKDHVPDIVKLYEVRPAEDYC